MESIPQTRRTRLQRAPKRGLFDRAAINAILDEAHVCHVAYAVDGQPLAVPTLHWRDGETLYLHGSAASRTMLALGDGIDVCVNVTLLDGLVLARSAFHHSVNYRSVTIFGQPRTVTGDAEKSDALRLLVEKLAPGRWDELRPMHRQELTATAVVALPISEASAKVRAGGPADDPEDLAWPVWAGVVPLATMAGPPIPDEQLDGHIPLPRYLKRAGGG